jgi:Uncharacterized protein conserved in bacteria
MKKRFLIAVVFSFMAFSSANAQLFWKVTGNGLHKASYLFGTHHVIDKVQIKDFDKIYAISGKTDAVVGEVDMRDSTIQAKMMQVSIMKDGTIKDLLSPEDYTLVDNEFKQLIGVGMDKLGHLKPAMLNSLYAVMLFMKEMGLNKQPETVDALFQKNARANGKNVIPLETAEFQFDIIYNTIPLKRQAEMLVKDVYEKQENIEILKQMNTFYLAGDMGKMEELDKKDDNMTLEERNLMMDNRNAKWLKQLPGLMSTQSCFIAVGFLHLIGNNGLICLLKKAGYTVEPMVF